MGRARAKRKGGSVNNSALSEEKAGSCKEGPKKMKTKAKNRSSNGSAKGAEKPLQGTSSVDLESGAAGGSTPAPPAAHPPSSSIGEMLWKIRARLTGVRAKGDVMSCDVPLRPRLNNIKEQLESIITGVVEEGHNNSILLVGDRGSGKSEALECALSNIKSKMSPGRVGVVRLSGLVTCDDRAVFKEMASQLCSLSDGTFSKVASFDENLNFLSETLEAIGSQKAIIFVLDELDAFAKRTKQTVLYNLLDSLQSPNVVACVVGLSSRHDAVELLEKRVQSRFSHRKVLVVQPQPPPLVADSAPGASNQDTASAAVVDPSPQEILQALLLPSEADRHSTKAAAYCKSVEQAVTAQEVKVLLDEAAAGGISPRWLSDVALLALSNMEVRGTGYLLQVPHVVDGIKAKLGMERGQANMVEQLSVLQLYLLVGLCRLERKQLERHNFEAVFYEYTALRRSNDDRCEKFARAAALRAFEELLDCGFVRIVKEAQAQGTLLEYQPVQLLLSYHEVDAGLKAHQSCPSILRQWLAKESVHRNVGLEL